MSADRAAYVAGLRALADVLESHPEVPLPYYGTTAEITIHFFGGEDPRSEIAAAARAIPCSWEKDVWESGQTAYLDLVGSLRGLKLKLVAFRDTVCTRRVTGTEEREVEVEVTPAVTTRVREQVDIVEWTCSPILAPADAAGLVSGGVA